MGTISNSTKVGKRMSTKYDDSLDGLTAEEIDAKVQAEIVENSMGAMEKMRRDNPTLNDAWEQIKTIRGLSEEQQKDINKRPAWERHYFEIAEGIETSNEALKEAWDRYYLLKNLIVGCK